MMKLFILCILLSSPVFAAQDFIPEASGVAKVGETLVIAGDEEPTSLWTLRSGALKKVFVQGPAWDDMEGLATIDEKSFFAITSHGLTKKGKRKAERENLFLMHIDARISVEKSWSLREQILTFLEAQLGSSLNMKEVRQAIPDKGGLNIEGLAYAEGKLYIGLRSPLTKDGEAIILVLKNSQTQPEIEKAIVLPLDHKGVRGLDQDSAGLVILSGSRNDKSEQFGLYHYSLHGQRMTSLSVKGFENLMRPEGVVKHSGGYVFVQDFIAPESQDVVVELSH